MQMLVYVIAPTDQLIFKLKYIQQSTKRWLIKIIQQYTLHWRGALQTGGVRSRVVINIIDIIKNEKMTTKGKRGTTTTYTTYTTP